MAEMQFSTPFEWCSIPRACKRKVVGAGPQISAAFTIISAGTPAIFDAYSGVYFLTISAYSSKPVVYFAMYSRSTHPRSIMMHLMIERGWVDREYIAKYTTGIDEYTDMV